MEAGRDAVRAWMDANVDKVLEFVAANVGRDRAAVRAEVEVDPISRLRKACEDYEKYAERVLDGLRRIADMDYDRIEGEVKSAPVRPKRIVRRSEIAMRRPVGGGQARFVASQPGAIAGLLRLERREEQNEPEGESETESDSIDRGGEDQVDSSEDQRESSSDEKEGQEEVARDSETVQEEVENESQREEVERESETVQEEVEKEPVREEEVERESETVPEEVERETVREEEVEEDVASSDLDDDNLEKVLPQSGFVAVGQKEPMGITGVSENQYQRFNTITRFPM